MQLENKEASEDRLSNAFEAFIMEDQDSTSNVNEPAHTVASLADAQHTALSEQSSEDIVDECNHILTKYIARTNKRNSEGSQVIELNELSDYDKYYSSENDDESSDESLVLPSKDNFVLNNLSVLKLKRRKEVPLFYLQYNTITDDYVSSIKDYTKKSWASLIYQSENLDYYTRTSRFGYLTRVFISRYEQCPRRTVGKIQWRFNLAKFTDWRRLQIRVHGRLYAGTWIRVVLVGHDLHDESRTGEKTLELNSSNLVIPEQFEFGVGLLDLIVTLSNEDQLTECQSSEAKRPKLFYQIRDKRPRESRDQRKPGFVFEIY